VEHCVFTQKGHFVATNEVSMIHNSVLRVRIDEKMKLEAEILFNSMGLTLSQAIRVFLAQSIANNGFPFDLKVEKRPLDK